MRMLFLARSSRTVFHDLSRLPHYPYPHPFLCTWCIMKPWRLSARSLLRSSLRPAFTLLPLAVLFHPTKALQFRLLLPTLCPVRLNRHGPPTETHQTAGNPRAVSPIRNYIPCETKSPRVYRRPKRIAHEIKRCLRTSSRDNAKFVNVTEAAIFQVESDALVV